MANGEEQDDGPQVDPFNKPSNDPGPGDSPPTEDEPKPITPDNPGWPYVPVH